MAHVQAPNFLIKNKARSAIIITLIALVMTGIFFWQSLEFEFFADINGLEPRLGTMRETLIEYMGEPYNMETIIDERGFRFYMLYYDGISFFIGGSDMVTQIIITGEQYRLGGNRNIGIGSTRRQVEADIRGRRWTNMLQETCGCSGFRFGATSDGSIWFSMNLERVEIEFYQNRVVHMSIGWVG